MCVCVCVCVCVCMHVCVFVGQCFLILCQSAPPHGDPWAMAISQLMLTMVTRLDSVCQSHHLAHTNLVSLQRFYKPLRG